MITGIFIKLDWNNIPSRIDTIKRTGDLITVHSNGSYLGAVCIKELRINGSLTRPILQPPRLPPTITPEAYRMMELQREALEIKCNMYKEGMQRISVLIINSFGYSKTREAITDAIRDVIKLATAVSTEEEKDKIPTSQVCTDSDAV